ncbi:MAG: type II toxin-antitoxin system RelE/ParE family toxin [Candidatus Pacearchaeota archaeon]|nr:type II toxin-antitoxin system RelE/ParE family toxin [Candidatus Pacearchaeota archaeon]
MNLKIDYDNQPKKFLKSQDKTVIKRIMDKIDTLSLNPIPHDAKRVMGYELPTFRIRIGKHRALYRVNYEEKRIIVVKIDKRDKVYD